HLLSIDQVASQLKTNIERGLTEDEAKQRLDKLGLNELKKTGGVKIWKILLRHTFGFMNIVLLAALVIAFAVQEWIDGAVIGFIILVNVVIGFVQEFRSENSMQKLKSLQETTSTVIRDGRVVEIKSKFLAVGDLIELNEGDHIPADCRVVYSAQLSCLESILTGESEPIKKNPQTIVPKPLPDYNVLGDRFNMVFGGTVITKGKGKAIVTCTGMNTELGAIAQSLNKSNDSKFKNAIVKFFAPSGSRLQKRMGLLGIVLVFAGLICTGLVLLGVYIHGTIPIIPDGLKIGVSTAVAVIPEGLAPVLTLTMTMGVLKMAKNNAIVRRLDAIESLGNITDICTDKTGTLTEGKMSVREVYLSDESELSVVKTVSPPSANHEPQRSVTELINDRGVVVNIDSNQLLTIFLTISSLCNGANIVKTNEKENQEKPNPNQNKKATEEEFVGDPTEIALLSLSTCYGLSKEKLIQDSSFTFHEEFPFDSTLKRMTVLYKKNGHEFILTKGALEQTLPLCSYMCSNSDNISILSEISEQDAEKIKYQAEGMAMKGLRVLSLAFRQNASFETITQREDAERQLTFVGLVGIQDPPRGGVHEAIKLCQHANLTVRVITGDHKITAKAIAHECGVIEADDEDLVMNASTFDSMSDHELRLLPDLPRVISRCTPGTKERMIEALHARKKYVAMTGDGVNDCSSIKAADVGIAMGITGSDVTKEVADIVLTDDDFSTIVIAIKEGRHMFESIRKFTIHLLSGNVSQTILLVVTALSGLQVPLNSIQILWLNLVTGTGPSFGLGKEKVRNDIMAPGFNSGMFTFETISDILAYGIVMGMLGMANFLLATMVWGRPLIEAQSLTFVTATCLLLLHAYTCRHLRKPFFEDGFYECWVLHLFVFLGLVSTIATLYIPWVNSNIFHQVPLNNPIDWVFVLFAGLLLVIFSEVYKGIKR
ncbi:predicted protein, partial [Naegleria gruberi]